MYLLFLFFIFYYFFTLFLFFFHVSKSYRLLATIFEVETVVSRFVVGFLTLQDILSLPEYLIKIKGLDVRDSKAILRTRLIYT